MGIRAYLPLFKLRICSLISFSAMVGLIAAQSTGRLSPAKVLLLVAATMLASASASAFNHYFDSDIDSVMDRTRRRPLAAGRAVGARTVLLTSGALFVISLIFAYVTLNRMVAIHLALGAFVYAFIYTAWLKRRSWLNIVVGGLAGSFAVLAGGASAQPELCVLPVLLAVVMFFWTPSHFWSFAIFHKEQYEKAGVPMLPVVFGDNRTAQMILANTTLLVITSLIPFFLGYLGVIYLVTAVFTGGYFIIWNIRLLRRPEKEIAWKNFKVSMMYLGALFTSVIIDMSLKGVL